MSVNMSISRKSWLGGEQKLSVRDLGRPNEEDRHVWPCDAPPKHKATNVHLGHHMEELVRAILGDNTASVSVETIQKAQRIAGTMREGLLSSLPNEEKTNDAEQQAIIEKQRERIDDLEAQMRQKNDSLDGKEEQLLEKDKQIRLLTQQVAGRCWDPNELLLPSRSLRLEELRAALLEKQESVRSKIDKVWFHTESELEKRDQRLALARDLITSLQQEVALWKEKGEILEEELQSTSQASAKSVDLERQLAEALSRLKRGEEEKDFMEKGYQEFLDDTLQSLKKSEAKVEELSVQVDLAIGLGMSSSSVDSDVTDTLDNIETRMVVTASKLTEAKWPETLQPEESLLIQTAAELLLEAETSIAVLKATEGFNNQELVEAKEVVEGDLNLHKKLLKLSNAKLEEATRKLREAGHAVNTVELSGRQSEADRAMDSVAPLEQSVQDDISILSIGSGMSRIDI